MAVKIDLAKKKISLGVGDLVAEPAAVAGRIAGLSVYTRMALGREAHTTRQVQQTWQHKGFARETTVRHKTTVDDFAVTIQGRIDGVYEPATDGEPWVVEEIKSVVMSPLAFASLYLGAYPHYIEQLRLYCYLLQRPATGKLVFINVPDNTAKTFDFTGSFDDCAELIANRVRALIDVAQDEQQQHAARRSRSVGLPFPHAKPRQHQDRMIAGIEHALAAGRHLLVSAPSGIGKTAGALYPVVKHALANDRRVFFVTAKNTQQAIALETLNKLEAPTGVAFRAREKMCINSIYACREEFCQHLQMFSQKLERATIPDRVITPEKLIETGQRASVCPFELALMKSEQADVIVCDYNYVFDPQVYLRRFFLDEDYSDAVLVIDEAHNLVARAMDYYSPTLRRRQIKELKHNLHHVEHNLARDIQKFLRSLDEFFEQHNTPAGDEYSQLDETEQRVAEKSRIDSPRPFFDELRPVFSKLSVRYLLDKMTSGRAIPDDPVEEFFSEYSQFCNVLAMEGDEFAYVFDATEGQSLKIVCLDPSRMLAERMAGFHSVIAMSATLEPLDYYRQMLGFDPSRTDVLTLPSPFPRENRRILVCPQVLTTYRQRSANYDRIAQIIATTAGARPGNYMALFPSYDFLRMVADRIPEGSWKLLKQEPRMTDAERDRVLELLKQPNPPKLVLAVQGGIFAEGVDYPGETLCGVIVVSPALPQVSYERELMRRYCDQRYGKGFEFAYLYPGMNRVIQSVGRLIRTETDRGVAVLVCQRFAQAAYTSLFPADWDGWQVTQDLDAELQSFWTGTIT